MHWRGCGDEDSDGGCDVKGAAGGGNYGDELMTMMTLAMDDDDDDGDDCAVRRNALGQAFSFSRTTTDGRPNASLRLIFI